MSPRDGLSSRPGIQEKPQSAAESFHPHLLLFVCYDDHHRQSRWGQETSRERTGREERKGRGGKRTGKMQQGEEEKVR